MPNIGTRVRLAGKALVGAFTDTDAKTAWGLLSGVLPGGLGMPPNRGTREYLAAYSQMPWLRAVADRIGTAVAATDWQLYVRGKPGDKARQDRVLQRCSKHARRAVLIKQAQDHDDLRQIEDHPLLDVIHDANSFQTGEQMRKVTQLHLDLVGEAFWLKERGALGQVTGVWPIPPDWVINTPTPTNPFYRVQFRAWRGLIPDTEFLWMCNPDPANPYGRGSGTGQSLADELETDEYAAKHTKAFFHNRARPDILVYPKSPAQMRQADVSRLEQDWIQSNAGFWRAFKPYFMTREVGVHEFEQNFRSLQLVQLREYERNTILQVFGIPPELLGVLENSNRATIAAADYLFARYVVLPRLEFMRGVLQERLIPEYDERLILDYVSPVAEDEDAQRVAAQMAPEALTIDEWRKWTGHDPLPDGKGEPHLFRVTVSEHVMGEKEDPEPHSQPDVIVSNPPKPPKEPPKASAAQRARRQRFRSVGDDDGGDDPSKLAKEVAGADDPDASAFVAWRRAAKKLLRGE